MNPESAEHLRRSRQQDAETILSTHPGVLGAVVVVLEDEGTGDARLVAYAVPDDDYIGRVFAGGEADGRSLHPGPNFTIPFGKARIVKPGLSLTLVTYGALVPRSLSAAQRIERENPKVSIEIIDLRSLAPYDWETVSLSVKKTNRALIVHEDCLSWGYGSELAARIGTELFWHLDAPVERIGALDTWVGYQPLLEDEILPQANDIFHKIETLLKE